MPLVRMNVSVSVESGTRAGNDKPTEAAWSWRGVNAAWVFRLYSIEGLGELRRQSLGQWAYNKRGGWISQTQCAPQAYSGYTHDIVSCISVKRPLFRVVTQKVSRSKMHVTVPYERRSTDPEVILPVIPVSHSIQQHPIIRTDVKLIETCTTSLPPSARFIYASVRLHKLIHSQLDRLLGHCEERVEMNIAMVALFGLSDGQSRERL